MSQPSPNVSPGVLQSEDNEEETKRYDSGSERPNPWVKKNGSKRTLVRKSPQPIHAPVTIGNPLDRNQSGSRLVDLRDERLGYGWRGACSFCCPFKVCDGKASGKFVVRAVGKEQRDSIPPASHLQLRLANGRNEGSALLREMCHSPLHPALPWLLLLTKMGKPYIESNNIANFGGESLRAPKPDGVASVAARPNVKTCSIVHVIFTIDPELHDWTFRSVKDIGAEVTSGSHAFARVLVPIAEYIPMGVTMKCESWRGGPQELAGGGHNPGVGQNVDRFGHPKCCECLHPAEPVRRATPKDSQPLQDGFPESRDLLGRKQAFEDYKAKVTQFFPPSSQFHDVNVVEPSCQDANLSKYREGDSVAPD